MLSWAKALAPHISSQRQAVAVANFFMEISSRGLDWATVAIGRCQAAGRAG
jgi:hypothetical protein